MSTPEADDRCQVCRDPSTGLDAEVLQPIHTCPHCKWRMCSDCLERHQQPTEAHQNHPAATGTCRGRRDTR